jgi:hypothetical protein
LFLVVLAISTMPSADIDRVSISMASTHDKIARQRERFHIGWIQKK